MRLEDCYALLDLPAGASNEEVRRAHRDLVKVWHPDRFGSDAALRRKAEEKLKQVNEAYETILASREGARFGGWRAPEEADAPPPPERAEPTPQQQVVRNRNWALICAGAAIFVLLRRPTPGGLLIALLLFCAAFVFLRRMRAVLRP